MLDALSPQHEQPSSIATFEGSPRDELVRQLIVE
jgi:hypothetical protein